MTKTHYQYAIKIKWWEPVEDEKGWGTITELKINTKRKSRATYTRLLMPICIYINTRNRGGCGGEQDKLKVTVCKGNSDFTCFAETLWDSPRFGISLLRGVSCSGRIEGSWVGKIKSMFWWGGNWPENVGALDIWGGLSFSPTSVDPFYPTTIKCKL